MHRNYLVALIAGNIAMVGFEAIIWVEVSSNHPLVVTLSAASILTTASREALWHSGDNPWALPGYTVLVVSTLDRRLTAEGQYLIDFDDHRVPLAFGVSIQLGLYRSTHNLLA